jgi:hypothetical protein
MCRTTDLCGELGLVCDTFWSMCRSSHHVSHFSFWGVCRCTYILVYFTWEDCRTCPHGRQGNKHVGASIPDFMFNFSSPTPTSLTFPPTLLRPYFNITSPDPCPVPMQPSLLFLLHSCILIIVLHYFCSILCSPIVP